jgi:sec-independent protein translocase protein TatA
MFALFNLGGGEIILILALILILFGARKLPELAKGLGQGIKEFKKATREVTDEINTAMTDDRTYTPPSNRADYTPPKKLPEDGTPETAAPVAQSTEQKS